MFKKRFLGKGGESVAILRPFFSKTKLLLTISFSLQHLKENRTYIPHPRLRPRLQRLRPWILSAVFFLKKEKVSWNLDIEVGLII